MIIVSLMYELLMFVCAVGLSAAIALILYGAVYQVFFSKEKFRMSRVIDLRDSIARIFYLTLFVFILSRLISELY